MGMYDEVSCDYPLPGEGPENMPGGVFQTKDFDCTLSLFTITEGGQLLKNGEPYPYTGPVEFYHPTYYALFRFGVLDSPIYNEQAIEAIKRSRF